MTLRELRKIGLGYMGMSPGEYGEICLGDFILKYEGWDELRRSDRADGWERTRSLAYYQLIQPLYRLNKFFNFNRSFPNPYIPKKKEKKIKVRPEVWQERVKKWDDLDYKIHPKQKPYYDAKERIDGKKEL